MREEHPAFPAPSVFQGALISIKARAKQAARMLRRGLNGPSLRAISSHVRQLAWSLAPCNDDRLFDIRIRKSFAVRSAPGRSVVPLAGIEPALLAELDFESSASTSSATGAFGGPASRRREAGGL